MLKSGKILKLSIKITLSKRAYIPDLKTGALRLILSKNELTTAKNKLQLNYPWLRGDSNFYTDVKIGWRLVRGVGQLIEYGLGKGVYSDGVSHTW